MKKRWIAAAMACTMTASLLAGCSSGSGQTEAGTQAESAKTEAGSEAAGDTAAAKSEELSGTITFTIWDNNLKMCIRDRNKDTGCQRAPRGQNRT